MDKDLKTFLEYIIHYTSGQLDCEDFTLEELSKATKKIQEKLELVNILYNDVGHFIHDSVGQISAVNNKATNILKFRIPKIKLKTGQDDGNVKLMEEYIKSIKKNCLNFFELKDKITDKLIMDLGNYHRID